MKKLLSIAAMALFVAPFLMSCDEDEERAYIIKYVVRANTDSAFQMHSPTPSPYFWTTRYYESGDTIKESDATSTVYLRCHCEDSATVLTGEIYVDGELRAKKDTTLWLELSCQFK